MSGRGQQVIVTWKVGLVNHQLKYLTAESFGFKINASGATLRKKQTWTVEQDPLEEDTVYIKSHTGRYLAGDKKGNATCDSDSKTEAEKFTIYYCPDQSGRWAIANKMSGYYLGGTDEIVQCYEKSPGASEWWYAHLAVHPQVSWKSYSIELISKFYAFLKFHLLQFCSVYNFIRLIKMTKSLTWQNF